MKRSRLLSIAALSVALAATAAACGSDGGDTAESATTSENGGTAESATTSENGGTVAVVSEEDSPAVSAGDGRLRPDEQADTVGVLDAANSQTGKTVDFSVFDGKNIGIVGVLPVPEVTIQTEPCQALIEANGGTSEFIDAAGDPNAAVQAIETFIGRGDAAIWNVSNAGEAVRPAIDSANEKSVPFIATYAGNEPGSIDIREDEWASGPTIAQYIGNHLGGQGKVAVLGSNSILTLLQRTTILESVLAYEFPDIEVVRWQDFDFTPEGARKIAEAGLQADPDIKAIFAHWDVPAAGGVQAVADLGRDVLITSFTGDNVTGYDLLRNGDIGATVGQSNAQIGMIACEYMALALAGESLPEDTLVPTGFVTADNVPGPEGVFNGRPYVLSTEFFPS